MSVMGKLGSEIPFYASILKLDLHGARYSREGVRKKFQRN